MGHACRSDLALRSEIAGTGAVLASHMCPQFPQSPRRRGSVLVRRSHLSVFLLPVKNAHTISASRPRWRFPPAQPRAQKKESRASRNKLQDEATLAAPLHAPT